MTIITYAAPLRTTTARESRNREAGAKKKPNNNIDKRKHAFIHEVSYRTWINMKRLSLSLSGKTLVLPEGPPSLSGMDFFRF